MTRSASTSTAPTSRTGGRRLHLIDLENVIGDPDACERDIARLWDVYKRHAVGVGPTDHVIVATGANLALAAWFALPAQGVQRRVRRGPDGADLALLDACHVEHDARRFDELVIASSDHIFTELAETARSHGMRTHQVIGRSVPSKTLMAACPTRTWLRLDLRSGLGAYRRRRFGHTAPRPAHELRTA